MTTLYDVPATAASRPETARPLENLLFSAALVARGLPWADLPARTLGLDALTSAGLTHRLMTHLRGRRDGRPVRLRTAFGTLLVPLTRADAEGLLARADGAGALGTASALAADGRRRGLSPHGVPAGAWDALTQEELAGLTGPVGEHLRAVLAARRADGALDGHHWHTSMLRLSRHVVLGAGAAADTLLSEMVRAATGAVGSRAYEERAAALRRRLAPYLADPEPGSLARRLPARSQGAPETHLAVAHALALVSTATSESAFQALALLAAGAATDAVTSPEAAVDLALEHYPPLPALVYPVQAPLDADEPAIVPGDEILYDRAMLGRRTPGEPTDPAWDLCGSPSGCATARFAALVGREVVRVATAGARPVLLAPRFALDRLPDSLGPGSVTVALVGADDPTVTAEAYGDLLPAYGARGRVGADRLDHHAERLSACAADPGWNGSETGERFRMALLAHADRCANAAADVRRAARWFSG
ncbi:hypothetical protein [Streptomyces sp. NPDC058623]|uniref:hypothetical protein n=1 Tax=Streptomyces sp. NPDC058623 TaxID=3346563 RepID=UPI003646AFEE